MRKQDNWMDKHLTEILHYQKLINETPEEDYNERLQLLSKMLVLIGKVAAQMSEDYKMIYARRKQVHAQTKIDAPSNKEARAELAVVELRKLEAQAYGDYKRWNNAFDSTKEEINALKYKIRVGIEDGSSKQGA